MDRAAEEYSGTIAAQVVFLELDALKGAAQIKPGGLDGDLSPLARLQALSEVHLYGCEQVSDLGPLGGRTGLILYGKEP